LSHGTWLGLYTGAGAISGQILSPGNITWSMGERRPYGTK
jgi:hypothetical protein